jgi:hypothetical protein
MPLTRPQEGNGQVLVWTFAKSAALACEKVAEGAMESDRAFATEELADITEDGEAVYRVTITAERIRT